jgi:hypothetical protein
MYPYLVNFTNIPCVSLTPYIHPCWIQTRTFWGKGKGESASFHLASVCYLFIKNCEKWVCSPVVGATWGRCYDFYNSFLHFLAKKLPSLCTKSLQNGNSNNGRFYWKFGLIAEICGTSHRHYLSWMWLIFCIRGFCRYSLCKKRQSLIKESRKTSLVCTFFMYSKKTLSLNSW